MKPPAILLCLLLALAVSPSLLAQSPASPAAASPVSAARPGKEISLPPSQVRDTFFAYFLGILMTGLEVDIDNAQMRDILTEFQTKLKFPFDLVTRVIQQDQAGTGARTISLIFNGDVDIPIPYSFLGYHPGMLRSTQVLNFRVTRTSYIDPRNPLVYTPVYDLALSDGSILLDVDDWLVYLLNRIIDKLQVRHIVFFSYQRKWIGLVEGRGRLFGRDMREYFDFTHNRIIYPVPDELDLMGHGFITASDSLADK